MICDIIREIQQVVVKADILEFRRGVWAVAVELEVFNILVAFKIMDNSPPPPGVCTQRTVGGQE